MWPRQLLTGSWWRSRRDRGQVEVWTHWRSLYLETRWETSQAGSAVCWGTPLTWKDVRQLPAARQGPRHVRAPEPGDPPPGAQPQPAELPRPDAAAVLRLRGLPPPPPRPQQRPALGSAGRSGRRRMEHGLPASSSAHTGRLVVAPLRAPCRSSGSRRRGRSGSCDPHHARSGVSHAGIQPPGLLRAAAGAAARIPKPVSGPDVARIPAETEPVRLDPTLVRTAPELK